MEGARASRWSAINRIGDTTKLTLDTEWPSHGSRDRKGAVAKVLSRDIGNKTI